MPLSGPLRAGHNTGASVLAVYDGALFASGGFRTAGGLPSVRIGEYRTGDTTTLTQLASSANPALVGEPVSYTISVIAAYAPADGGVELSSEIDGVICSITSSDASGANTAIFACEHTWTEPGIHILTASFTGSEIFADSSDQITQMIVADEFIFDDRFELP